MTLITQKEELTDKKIKDFQTVINTAQLNYPTGEKYVIKQEDKEYLEQKVENAVKKYKNTLEYIVLMGMKIDNQETFKEILEKNFNDYKKQILDNLNKTQQDIYEYKEDIEILKKNKKISNKTLQEQEKIIREYFNEKNKKKINHVKKKVERLADHNDVFIESIKNLYNSFDQFRFNRCAFNEENFLFSFVSSGEKSNINLDKNFALIFNNGYDALLKIKNEFFTKEEISFGAAKYVVNAKAHNTKTKNEKTIKLAIISGERDKTQNVVPYGIKEQIKSANQVILGNDQMNIYEENMMENCHDRGYITGEELKEKYPKIYERISVKQNKERTHDKLSLKENEEMDLRKKIRFLLTDRTYDNHTNNYFYKVNEKEQKIEDIIQFDFDTPWKAFRDSTCGCCEDSDYYKFIYTPSRKFKDSTEKDRIYDENLTIFTQELDKMLTIEPETAIAITCHRLLNVYSLEQFLNKQSSIIQIIKKVL